MALDSQNIKYVKLDDGVSFSLVRTNPKLTTNTKLMYNGKKMYMESYASSELLNRTTYKNVSVKQNSSYNKDIVNFLNGSGSQAYNVYQNFSNIAISDSYDNQFETLYWCGAEYIDSSFYSEEIGFVAPLYLREKLPNYFLIFRLDSPSNYNFNIGEDGSKLDSSFDFKTDILDKAVLIKSFDLREGSVLGNYIHNYIDQESFEFDKSMYVNFSNAEVTYYGINRTNGVLEKKVENFENELLKNDNPIFVNDKWFTEGFERNGLIFPYIMNIEYLFNDDTFKQNGRESYEFARYIGLYCNNIEFGEFENLTDLDVTEDDVIYYFEDNNKNLHRYSKKIDESGSVFFQIDGKDIKDFNENLISGFEKEKITAYAEPLDINEGFINRAQYGFEILKPLEPGDWIGIKYNKKIDCYFADDMSVGEYSDFRFSVSENSTLNDIAKALVNCINNNKNSKFEARCLDNFVVVYAKQEDEEYNDAKILLESSLLYNKKISLYTSNGFRYVESNDDPIEDDSTNDSVIPVENEKSSFGNYYEDSFCGACEVYIDQNTETYKNIFKIYGDESVFFELNRYLKTNNGNGRKISANMIYINAEGKIEPEYRIVIVDDIPKGKENSIGYNVSVSSTYQVEIMDKFKPNYGIFSWFPVKDFDFDINFSTYGQYGAFTNECEELSERIVSNVNGNSDSDSDEDYNVDREAIKGLAKSHFFDDYNNPLESEYEYYYEQIHPNLCLISKSVPYVSKWGYYDEQKDSCENPYRLNVSKIFGESNLSANTNVIKCDEKEYTHSMPYYMTFKSFDKLNIEEYNKKNYQYISISTEDKKYEEYINSFGDNGFSLNTFKECVEYWIEKFKDTEKDMFSDFFSGKKYGKRFDRKYSRLLGGDKFHNTSTLFRGVKFEVIRQYNGVEKRTSEYNDYKFSFIYIPVMNDSMVFKNTVYFVKNDTFKFIVGIIFVNTMLGKYNNAIFGEKVDYFNKGFLYAACKDLIRPVNPEGFTYSLIFPDGSSVDGIKQDNEFCSENKGDLYLWTGDNNKVTGNRAFVTKTNNVTEINDIIGEFDNGNTIKDFIKDIKKYNQKWIVENVEYGSDDTFKFKCVRKYDEYDITISGYTIYNLYGKENNNVIKCEVTASNIKFKDLLFVDMCDYKIDQIKEFVDVSQMSFKSNSLKNILIKIGIVYNIKFYYNNKVGERINLKTISGENFYIKVNDVGNITITPKNDWVKARINVEECGIENLKFDIEIVDKFDSNNNSLSFKDYFSIFEQLSIYNIMESINNDTNVEYISTVEDNKYKIRVVKPDSIEIKDKYEAVPVEITQNNKSVIGSVEIKEKTDVDKIGVKTINRYSGFYNPIFNDILYYDDINIIVYSDDSDGIDIVELPYSNAKIDYKYSDEYGQFGVIKNMYYHKTNISRSDNILTSEKPIYPAINEYALDYRDYNIFSSSWDEGYFITQDDLDTHSVCDGIGSMKDNLCMFGSRYLNLPDDIFIDTFENGELWDEKMMMGIRDNTDSEIMYREINDRTVRYYLFIEKRLKRYLKESLIDVFSKYINKEYSFGNKGTIEDDIDEYVEKNLMKLYKVDKVYMYIKSDKMKIHDKQIENEYLKYMVINNQMKINNGFPVVSINGKKELKNSQFIMSKINEFDRTITYNLKPGFKESFGIAVSFKRK